MARYRKKPVVIEAVQVPPACEIPSNEMVEFLESSDCPAEITNDGMVLVHTLEGTMEALPGDWIISGIKGELYPCKPDIFEATYELAEAAE